MNSKSTGVVTDMVTSHTGRHFMVFRLDCPFLALSELAESIDLNGMNYDIHSHIPYLILFLKALALWKEKYGEDDFPDNREKRKTFETVCIEIFSSKLTL